MHHQRREVRQPAGGGGGGRRKLLPEPPGRAAGGTPCCGQAAQPWGSIGALLHKSPLEWFLVHKSIAAARQQGLAGNVCVWWWGWGTELLRMLLSIAQKGLRAFKKYIQTNAGQNAPAQLYIRKAKIPVCPRTCPRRCACLGVSNTHNHIILTALQTSRTIL